MIRYYKIGDFHFGICSDLKLDIPEHFRLFETAEEDIDYLYTIAASDSISEPEGELVYKTYNIAIYNKDGLEKRLISIYGESSPYALYSETDEKNAEILIRTDQLEETLKYDTTFTALFALETKMAERDSLILHSSSIHYGNGAVLFSAPSGTGKTAQSEQWRKYRGNTTINGDRNLLTKINEVWCMRGWPICGSSEICHNEEHPVTAIVMLEQAVEDSIRRLHGMQAYARIFPEITCGRWDKKKALHIMDLAEKLVSEVPVFLLKCTISENAVCILENELQKL